MKPSDFYHYSHFYKDVTILTGEFTSPFHKNFEFVEDAVCYCTYICCIAERMLNAKSPCEHDKNLDLLNNFIFGFLYAENYISRETAQDMIDLIFAIELEVEEIKGGAE